MAPDQILSRIDRALAELQEIRAAVAGERADGELTEDEKREIADLAAEHAARLRRGERIRQLGRRGARP